MIANKHTEMRIFDNLNSLLRASLDEKEYKERISRHIRNYIVDYVDEHSYEQGIYDIFEELGNSYQKHCWNIAKRIKDEILEEKKETNWLNPEVYTKEFEETMKEELTNKVLPHYFKELNNQLSIYEYKNKISNLKEREVKQNTTKNKEEIHQLVRERIESAYKYCFNQKGGNSRLVLTNFENVYNVRETIFNEVVEYVKDSLDLDVNKADIRPIFEKTLNSFIKEKREVLGIKKETKREKDTLGKIIPNPKLAQWVIITKMWKDITK